MQYRNTQSIKKRDNHTFHFKWSVMAVFFLLFFVSNNFSAFSNDFRDTLEVHFKKNSDEITKQSKKEIREFVKENKNDTSLVLIAKFSEPWSCYGYKKVSVVDKYNSILNELLAEKFSKNNFIIQSFAGTNYNSCYLVWESKTNINGSSIPVPNINNNQ